VYTHRPQRVNYHRYLHILAFLLWYWRIQRINRDTLAKTIALDFCKPTRLHHSFLLQYRTTFRDQIWWKSAVAKLPKERMVYQRKKLGLRGTRPSPHFGQNGSIAPKISWTLSPLDLSTCTEFGPDRLRFAGLIPERLIFRPKEINTRTWLLTSCSVVTPAQSSSTTDLNLKLLTLYTQTWPWSLSPTHSYKRQHTNMTKHSSKETRKYV